MRFHVLGLPNTQTTKEYSVDGFSAKTIRFCNLLKMLGHQVILYASEQNEAKCDELVTCITKEEQETLLMGNHYSTAAMDDKYPMWQLFNTRAEKEIGKRKQPKDFICLLGGTSQKWVCDRHPDLMAVEYGIGYIGSFAPYRVFESHSWRHMTYGMQGIEDGRNYDEVIYNFFDPDEFPVNYRIDRKRPYLLYGGRIVSRKGILAAQIAAREAGMHIKAFGFGDRSLLWPTTEYLGTPSEAERNKIISEAAMLLAPTMYVEPFNNVVAQAQMCGVPCVTTNFGAFTETIAHGETGFRCNTLEDMVNAIKCWDGFDRRHIRLRAMDMFSVETAASKYAEYFDRLSGLWNGGWFRIGDRIVDQSPEKNFLWYPGGLKEGVEKAADSGKGMWAEWAKEVEAAYPNYAADKIFVDQSMPDSQYKHLASQISNWPMRYDEAGKDRDAAYGARVVDTCLGGVTRQWLDNNVERAFIEANATGDLSGKVVLDIGAGYGRFGSCLPESTKYIATDGVEISKKIAAEYLSKHGPKHWAICNKDDVPSINADIAINVHSWSECSIAEIEEWIEVLAKSGTKHLFTVTHGHVADGTAYMSWSRDGKSFKPLIEKHYDLVIECETGLNNHPHAIWKLRG